MSRDHKILVKAYVTYVRPILEYCSAVWSPHRIDLINKLEDVQRRFTKKLNGLANLSYDKRLEILGLDALQSVQCYSIVHGHSCMKPADVFVLHSSISASITRGHNFKLFKPQCSLDVRKYSFAYRVIDIWNSLSSDIDTACSTCSTSVFKDKLEFVVFTPLCEWSLHSPVCLIVLLFSFVGRASMSFGPVCPDFCLNK